MAEPTRGPHRFRQRLTTAFVATAAVGAATLGLLTYGVTHQYRWSAFERRSATEVRLALALAPDRLDDATFARMQAAYEERAGASTVALAGERTFSTASALTAADVPAEVRDGPPGELVTTRASVGGDDVLVVAGDGPDGSRYAFFFRLDQVQDSLRELRTVLLGGWVAVVLLAAAVGQLVARRTLRPVRQAAAAATAIADGDLGARLPPAGDDEFGAWAESFNHMADELEATVRELAAAAERQRQLTADVAHDLRTPLTGMAAAARLLADGLDDLPDPTRRAATVLVRDVERLRALVLDLLELARLDARADPVLAEDVELAEAVDAVVDALPVPEGRTVEVAVSAGLRVRAERSRLRRILANVVGNALQHGAGTVRVAAERRGDVVEVRVADEGPGLGAEEAERVFDRFTKGDTSRGGGGSGLGLAIAREHARAQGGDVALVGGEGPGATFAVTLPSVGLAT